jgi:hypothetical protein
MDYTSRRNVGEERLKSLFSPKITSTSDLTSTTTSNPLESTMPIHLSSSLPPENTDHVEDFETTHSSHDQDFCFEDSTFPPSFSDLPSNKGKFYPQPSGTTGGCMYCSSCPSSRDALSARFLTVDLLQKVRISTCHHQCVLFLSSNKFYINVLACSWIKCVRHHANVTACVRLIL